MNDKKTILLIIAAGLLLFCLGTNWIDKEQVEEPKEETKTSDVITDVLYLPLTDDKDKSLDLIKGIKEDYYFKTDKTGYWKMITNESNAISDGVFVVTLMSYEDNESSRKFVKEFSYYLKSWFKFKELENDWTEFKI